jgi:uncharacterized protein DUF4019
MRRQVWACMAAIAAVAAVSAWATDRPEDAARPAVESWLELVDAGKYGAAWDQAAKLFKRSITKEQWKQTTSRARSPLGKLISRKLKYSEYTKHLPGAPDGNYVIIQFESVFEQKTSAVETVTSMLDADGVWRVSGYFIR